MRSGTRRDSEGGHAMTALLLVGLVLMLGALAAIVGAP